MSPSKKPAPTLARRVRALLKRAGCAEVDAAGHGSAGSDFDSFLSRMP